MEGSDETGVMQRIQSSFGNCSSSIYNKQSVHQLGINGQMQNLSVVEGITATNNSITNNSVSSNSKRPAGIPPSHPHSHFVAPKIVPLQVGATHSRSLSQSSFFSFDHLPPLSPSVFRESGIPVSGSNEVPLEDKDGGLRGINEGLPPRRGHRRSRSDVVLGFDSGGQSSVSQFVGKEKEKEKEKEKPAQLVLKRELDWGGGGSGNGGGEGGGERKSGDSVVDDLFSAYMNLDNLDALNSSSMEDKDMDSRASGTRTNDSSENEVESSIAGNSHGIHGATSRNLAEKSGKRSAPGDLVPTARHFRSLSMDSFMGNLNFSDDSPKLPPSPGIRSAHHSPSNSFDGNTSQFSLEFANGDFSPAELKKIMENEKLAEIAVSDPKRVKRILANRQSAARSKERKLRYIAELEHKVQTLQTEATTLSAQLTHLQRDSAGLTNQNNELRFRLQAMEQQAQLRDALHEALTAEVQRLKLVSAEMRGEAPQNCLPQQVMANNQMLQMQPSQYMYQLQQQQQQNNRKQQQAPQQENQQNQTTESQQDAEASKN